MNETRGVTDPLIRTVGKICEWELEAERDNGSHTVQKFVVVLGDCTCVGSKECSQLAKQTGIRIATTMEPRNVEEISFGLQSMHLSLIHVTYMYK